MWCNIYLGILTAVAVTSITDGAIVETSQGAVQGKESVGLNNASFVSYMGIPYAKQPVGELRFQAPKDPEPWDGVLDGTTERASCIQFDDIYGLIQQHSVPEDEACLYLNVHVPSTKTTKKAVFIFIHGGAFSCGSGNTDLYGPEYIVSKDVILVTFNYRLGLFGFICLDTPEAPGNMAGRDMVAALRWVRRNIAAFGGDPDNITVGGHSAGATAAQFVAISPLSAGFLKRVIIMGGGGFQDWAIVKQKKSALTMDFVQKLNITETNPKEVLNKLKSLDANEISRTGRQFYIEKGLAAFTFVLEEQFDGVEPFLAVDPKKAIMSKDNVDVEYMTGFNNREGIFPAYFVSKRGLLDYYNTVPGVWVPQNILSSLETEQIDDVGNKIKKFFVGDITVTENNLEKFVDYCSSYLFYYGTIVTARLRSSVSKAPVYVYQFSYEGDIEPFKSMLKWHEFKGVCHGDELSYIFKVNSILEGKAPGTADAEIRDKTLALWMNFVKHGNPTPEPNDLLPVKWNRTSGHNVVYYNIANPITMERKPDDEAVQFWDKLYQEYAPSNFIS